MFRYMLAAFAVALSLPGGAVAQTTPPRTGTASVVPGAAMGYGSVGGPYTPVTPATPLPTFQAVKPATSAALMGTAAAGSTAIGPLTPELGRGIRVILRGTWSGTFSVSTSVDGCVTQSPLTVAGTTWGSFTGNANETVDVPTVSGVVYCATAAVTSGSLLWALRQ